ncbi:hypothetical protein EDB83DRAFT_2379824, partial [Lactarius deliciosus]
SPPRDSHHEDATIVSEPRLSLLIWLAASVAMRDATSYPLRRGCSSSTSVIFALDVHNLARCRSRPVEEDMRGRGSCLRSTRLVRAFRSSLSNSRIGLVPREKVHARLGWSTSTLRPQRRPLAPQAHGSPLALHQRTPTPCYGVQGERDADGRIISCIHPVPTGRLDQIV